MIRKLHLVWGFLDLLLASAGGISLAFSIIWAKPDLLFNAIIKPSFRLFGLIIGVALLATSVISIPAIIQPNRSNGMLKALNILLLSDAILTTIGGSVVWFFSLRQRSGMSDAWNSFAAVQQATLQDQLQCCGYWNGTAAGALTSATGFCADAAQAAIATGCVTPITQRSDYTLENTFTAMYGFVAVAGLFFIATACVINERIVAVRFARIDEKRGGGGFV